MSWDRANKIEDSTEDICTSDTSNELQPSTARKNEPWGYEFDKKDPLAMRLYFHNINGLITQNLGENWIDILHFMEANHTDIYGLAETNVTWNP